MGVTLRLSGVAGLPHHAQQRTGVDVVTHGDGDRVEMGEVIAHVVAADEGDVLAAAGCRVVDRGIPRVLGPRLGDPPPDGRHDHGSTTEHVGGRIVVVFVLVADDLAGERKHIDQRSRCICRRCGNGGREDGFVDRQRRQRRRHGDRRRLDHTTADDSGDQQKAAQGRPRMGHRLVRPS